jgi:hypothetical protein
LEYCFNLGTRDSRNKHEAYLKLLEKCFQQTKNPYVKKILLWIKHPETSKQVIADIKEFWIESPNHKINEGIQKDRLIFFVNDTQVTDIPEIKKFWQQEFCSQQNTKSGFCLISGAYRDDILISAVPFKISGINNVQASGGALISFDKSAYQTHGWNKNENATIGLEPVGKVYSFINYLANTLAFDKAIANKALSNCRKYHLKLSNCSVLIWSNKYYIDPEYWHCLSESQLQNNSSTEGLMVFRENSTGNLVPTEDLDLNETVNLLVLKGNAGRVAIEEYHSVNIETTLVRLHQFIAVQSQVNKNFSPTPYWQLTKPSIEGHFNKDIDLSLITSIILGIPLPQAFLTFLFEQQVEMSNRICSNRLLQGISVYLEFKSNNSQKDLSETHYSVLLGKIAFCFHQFHVILADYYKTNLISTNMMKLSRNDITAWNLVLNCFYQVHLNYPNRFLRLSLPLKRYLLTLMEKLVNTITPNLIKLTPLMMCNPMLDNTYSRYWSTAFIPAFNKIFDTELNSSEETSALFYYGFNQGKIEFFNTLKNGEKK